MKTKKRRKKLIVESVMKDLQNFHTGGTVTGRISRLQPDTQELYIDPRRWAHLNHNTQQLHRLGEPVAPVIVTMDFSDIERRIVAQLESKTNFAEAMLKAVSQRIDEEGCGATIAAARGVEW